MSAQRLVRGSKHLGMIRETKIIVRAEIDHRPRFPGIIDHGAGIRSREKLGLIQFNGPRAERIQFVKLAGACSGSSLSPARKLLKLSFAGSSFIDLTLRFARNRLAQTVFPSKTDNFLFH